MCVQCLSPCPAPCCLLPALLFLHFHCLSGSTSSLLSPLHPHQRHAKLSLFPPLFSVVPPVLRGGDGRWREWSEERREGGERGAAQHAQARFLSSAPLQRGGGGFGPFSKSLSSRRPCPCPCRRSSSFLQRALTPRLLFACHFFSFNHNNIITIL